MGFPLVCSRAVKPHPHAIKRVDGVVGPPNGVTQGLDAVDALRNRGQDRIAFSARKGTVFRKE